MLQEGFKNILKWGIGFLILFTLIIVYKVYNPSENIYFPKCPFRVMTGYKCPGCGSQRAIHSLLNFDIRNAVNENAILLLSIPYLIMGFAFDLIKKPNKKILKWRKRLFGVTAIYVILFVILTFWILRNITY